MNIFKFLRKDYTPWQSWIWLVVAVIVFILFLFFNKPEVGAVLFTGVLIFWYSIETRNLVKETKLSNALSVQPVLVMGYHKNGTWTIFLRNIGKGAGIDINIKSKDPNYELVIDNSILAQNEKVNIRIYKKRENGEPGLVEDYWKEFQSKPLEVVISFRNTLRSNELYAIGKICNPPRIDMTI